MPGPEIVLLFLGAALVLNLTPGPDMMYVAARSVSDGATAGIVAAFGVAGGLLLHVAALALGLAALLAAAPLAYTLIRVAGAIYLIALGLRLLLRPRGATPAARLPRATLRAIFLQGVITNALNPKVALFFLAFLPQFVDPAGRPAALQFLLLGLLFNVQGTAVNVLVAMLASRGTAWLRSNEWRVALLQRFTGVVFLLLGARLAFAPMTVH
jgi:threonine/homoserine/homoserine lactone efflux protein